MLLSTLCILWRNWHHLLRLFEACFKHSLFSSRVGLIGGLLEVICIIHLSLLALSDMLFYCDVIQKVSLLESEQNFFKKGTFRFGRIIEGSELNGLWSQEE